MTTTNNTELERALTHLRVEGRSDLYRITDPDGEPTREVDPAAATTEAPIEPMGRATPPAPTATQRRRIILVLDTENVVGMYRDAGIPFDPIALRNAVRTRGEVLDAFAIANLHAVEYAVQERLGIAGFHLMHHTRLRDSHGGKDTVDENIVDFLQRLLAYGTFDAVAFAGDDRNFAPITNQLRDRGIWTIGLTLRSHSTLSKLFDEVIRLPEDNGERRTSTVWNPDVILADLRALPTMSRGDREEALTRIRLRAPTVYHAIRQVILTCSTIEAVRREMRTRDQYVTLRRLVDIGYAGLRGDDRLKVSRQHIEEFLSVLIDLQVFEKIEYRPSPGVRLPHHQPVATHPFVQHVLGIRTRGRPQPSDGVPVDRVVRPKRTPPARRPQPKREQLCVIVRRPGDPPPKTNGKLHVFHVTDPVTTEVLEITAHDVAEAMEMARNHHRQRPLSDAYTEVDRGRLFASLRLLQGPPGPGANTIRIPVEAA